MSLRNDVWTWLTKAYPIQPPDETTWNLYHFHLLDRRPWREYNLGDDVLRTYQPNKAILS